MRTNNMTYGQVREIPNNVEETRVIPFILSTPTRDRHHTILNQNRWKLDNYRNNPVVGYMHNLYGNLCNPPNPDDVIGKAVSVGVEDINGEMCLCGKALFEPEDLNLQAEKIFQKLLFGTLSGVSVGFLEVGAGQWGSGSEAEGRENETYRFLGQELIEFSIVNIPSNPNGAKRALRDHTKGALLYAFRALGNKYSLSQLSDMRIFEVLNLLEGKKLGIREKDPSKLKQQLISQSAIDDQNALIERQQIEFRKFLINRK